MTRNDKVKISVNKRKYYIDSERNFVVEARNKFLAWRLIRDDCNRLGLNVPKISEIYEYEYGEEQNNA